MVWNVADLNLLERSSPSNTYSTVCTLPHRYDEQFPFVVLDALYEQMLALEDQLLCKGFQGKMDEKNDKKISPFSVFQGCLLETTKKSKNGSPECSNLRWTMLGINK